MDHTQAQVSTRALAHTNMFTKHRHGHREREIERETCKCDEWANACMLCKCLYTLVSIHVKEQASFYKMLNLFFTCKKLSVHKLQLIHDLFFFFLWWNLILFHINRNFNIIGCPDKAKILNKNISSWTLFCATLMLCGERKKKKRDSLTILM